MIEHELAAETAQWLGKILNVEVDPAARDANLYEVYEADSMDIVDIVETLGDTYGIHVPNNKVRDIKTFGDVLDLASKK